MEERIQQLLKEKFGRGIDQCTKSEIFDALMRLTREELNSRPRIQGKKKLYYISAEFLMGKLLSNNLINLGIYGEVEKILEKHKISLPEIEEMELEPSLGNGGLGRLAACFLDSIATLGLPGDGVGSELPFRTLPPGISAQQAEGSKKSLDLRKQLAGEAAGIFPGAL